MPVKRISAEVVLRKQCSRCFETRPVSEFGINRRVQWDGRQPHCLECGRKAQRAYRAARREALR
jgi:hypothetical protein